MKEKKCTEMATKKQDYRKQIDAKIRRMNESHMRGWQGKYTSRNVRIIEYE